MICPVCQTHIEDGSEVCPACRANLSQVRLAPDIQPTYCKQCGALISPGEVVCSSCGSRIAGQGSVRVKKYVPPVEEDEADVTNSMPRIESALPTEDTQNEEHPHTKAVLLAAIGALVVVGGLTLAIAHPWDPDAYSERATKEADTSQAGFPGAIDSLSGQDSKREEEPAETEPAVELTPDEAAYQRLNDIYLQLKNFSAAIQNSEDTFFDVAFAGDAAAVQEGKDAADKLAIELSNLIDSISQVDVSSGTYSECKDNLTTLGNWLRNRSDSQREAWSRAVSSANPAEDRAYVEEPIILGRNDGGTNAYQALFDASYEDWAPKAP